MVAREGGLQSSRQLTPQYQSEYANIPVTHKGVDWGVEVLGVPKEEGVLMCAKVRHQHSHHSIAKRRKPVYFSYNILMPPLINHLDNLALHTGTLVDRDEESVSTVRPLTL